MEGRLSSNALDPVVLSGSTVRLEPLTLAHFEGLCEIGLDPELWRWIPTPVTSREEMGTYVAIALDEQRKGQALPFAIVAQATGRPIGSTRYANISLSDRRLEIGWSWLTSAYHRTSANTEAKLLLLTYAFESLNCMRVEFKTDELNSTSRRAIARLGAVQEGVFRKHRLTASGRIRNTVYYSIIDTEWPEVKARLRERLNQS